MLSLYPQENAIVSRKAKHNSANLIKQLTLENQYNLIIFNR